MHIRFSDLCSLCQHEIDLDFLISVIEVPTPEQNVDQDRNLITENVQGFSSSLKSKKVGDDSDDDYLIPVLNDCQ